MSGPHTLNVDCRCCGAKDTKTGLDEAELTAAALAWKRAHEPCLQGKTPHLVLWAELGPPKP